MIINHRIRIRIVFVFISFQIPTSRDDWNLGWDCWVTWVASFGDLFQNTALPVSKVQGCYIIPTGFRWNILRWKIDPTAWKCRWDPGPPLRSYRLLSRIIMNYLPLLAAHNHCQNDCIIPYDRRDGVVNFSVTVHIYLVTIMQ